MHEQLLLRACCSASREGPLERKNRSSSFVKRFDPGGGVTPVTPQRVTRSFQVWLLSEVGEIPCISFPTSCPGSLSRMGSRTQGERCRSPFVKVLDPEHLDRSSKVDAPGVVGAPAAAARSGGSKRSSSSSSSSSTSNTSSTTSCQ